jgi:hypothetical protein
LVSGCFPFLNGIKLFVPYVSIATRAVITEGLKPKRTAPFVSVVRDKLKMEAGIIQEMFRPIVNDIIRQVGCLLKTKQTYEIKNIIMVGGFSESEYVQKSIQTSFPDINVLIPEDQFRFQITFQGKIQKHYLHLLLPTPRHSLFGVL